MNPEYMELALDLARQGVGRVSPNPAVGAVLVRANEIIGRGLHTWAGVKHAEIDALEQAGDRARGGTMYVTLEPCSHQGRTGPCADALIRAGVRRVVAPMEDPNPEVAGRGFERLRGAGVEVELAPEYGPAAERLNDAFVHAMRTGRPLVTMKAALTLDGKIAGRPGDTGWITSDAARAHGQGLRHDNDAIITGIGTVLADDPMLTDRTGEERSRLLLRVVLDSKLRIPLDSRLVSSVRGDLVVFTTEAADESRRSALEKRGVRVVVSDGGFSALMKFLAEGKYRSALIEAGAGVNGAALDAGIVDKVFFYYAPKIMGGLQSMPLAAGLGRPRSNPFRIERTVLHRLPPDEFALEGYVYRDR